MVPKLAVAGLAAFFAAAEAYAQVAVPLPQRPPASRPAPIDLPTSARPAAETPAAQTGLVEDAFQATTRTAPVSESRPVMARAPLPPRRPTEASDEATMPAETPAGLPLAEPMFVNAPFAEAPRRREPGRLFSEKQYPIGRAAYLPIIRRFAVEARVPIDLADAVATIESAYDPHAVGASEEIGLMQVREQMSKAQGFEGSAQDLFEPETNVRIAVAHLSAAWERSGGNLCEALMRYRLGLDETRMSPLSLEYCRRALTYLTSIESPLARGVNVPGAARVVRPVGAEGTGLSAGRGGRFDWDAHDRRMRTIDNQFGGQNFGIIAR